MSSGGAISEFALSPNGAQVAYLVKQTSSAPQELFWTRVDGSESVYPVNDTLVAGGSVSPGYAAAPTFQLSPDGRTVVYHADQDTDGVGELFAWEWREQKFPNLKLIWPEYWFWWLEIVGPERGEYLSAQTLFGKDLPLERYGSDWLLLGVDARSGLLKAMPLDEPLRPDTAYTLINHAPEWRSPPPLISARRVLGGGRGAIANQPERLPAKALLRH